MRFVIPLILLVVSLAAPAEQTPSLVFEGCTDARGGPIPAVAEPSQAAFVETRQGSAGAELHYNADALPRRKDLTRAFLFAQACARHNLGLAPTGLSVSEARKADCWGLSTLMRSQLVADESGVAAIQADLDLSADEWARLPGPARAFNLGACYREAIRLPSSAPPSGNQRDLNACLHGCGDRLFRCQGGALSASGACMQQFETCEAACGR
ncbi:MAG: hypothetical protein KDH20_11365 [Rhodocyclaceae bacterium]|nr:hypothetical protein [Rhodocyclaceae bacterium]